MPKILQINVTCNWGSTGRIAEDIGKLAIAEGWESYIAYGRYKIDSSSNIIKIGTKIDYLFHGALSRITDRTGFYSKRATKAFLKEIDKIKPDIIHLHNIHGYYIHIGLLFDFIVENNIPIVWTLHDCWSFTGHCSHFDYIGCERWKSGCYGCPLKSEYPASSFLDNSKQNYEDKKRLFNAVEGMTIIPVSNWLGGLVEDSFLGKKDIKVIQNGIDTDVFRPSDGNLRERHDLSNKKILLGVSSVWNKMKGLDDFIALSKEITEDQTIVLIGVDEKTKSALPRNIIAISRTNSLEELMQWYSTADVFINPTWNDSFPTTNLEALACGTPIVTYRTGGSVEAVTEKTGLIVEKGDIDGLQSAIDAILANGKGYYSDACRKRAVKHFNKQDRYKEYIGVYKEMLKN